VTGNQLTLEKNMNSTLLAVLFVLAGSSLAMSASLKATGFRPGKAIHPSHHHPALSPSHHRLMDLESEEKVKHAKKGPIKPVASAGASFEEKQDHKVQELLEKAASHMQQLEFDFQAVKADMSALKDSEQIRLKHAAKKPVSLMRQPNYTSLAYCLSNLSTLRSFFLFTVFFFFFVIQNCATKNIPFVAPV
jgi:hypothetical protein